MGKNMTPPKSKTSSYSAIDVSFPDQATPVRIPLALHVQTAATLLKGEDYRAAAKAALRLIEVCGLIGGRMELAGEELSRYELEAEALGWSGKEVIPYVTATKVITGKERADRAHEDYVAFSKTPNALPRSGLGVTLKDERAVDIGVARAVGFSPIAVLKLRDRFKFLRDNGLVRNTRRSNEKLRPRK